MFSLKKHDDGAFGLKRDRDIETELFQSRGAQLSPTGPSELTAGYELLIGSTVSPLHDANSQPTATPAALRTPSLFFTSV
jgi:hypothetical protein